MAISEKMSSSIEKSSWIRKMFEEGIELKKKFGAENVFDFSLGNPDLQPPDRFFEVIAKCGSDKTPGIHGYMPNAGFLDVREKIAKRVSTDHNVEMIPGNVIMTVGAAGGLNVIFKAILNPGEQVIVQKPFFVEYNAYVDNHAGKLVLIEPTDSLSLNLEMIEKSINSSTKAVLINSPHNPTGVVYSEQQILELCEILKRKTQETGNTIYLIADEPYREIVYDGVVVPTILDKYDESIVVNSYSKSLSISGERIGYIALSPASKTENIMAAMVLANRILGFVNAPAVLQRAVAELLDEKVQVDVYAKRRDLLCKALDDAGLSYPKPKGAFYVFCKSPIEDDVKFVNYLKQFNILSVPGSGFGGAGYFRLSYCVSEDTISRATPVFKKAMDEWK